MSGSPERTPRGRALRRYHEATKHSPESVARSAHRLDWANKPLPFKVYTTLEATTPPGDLGRLCRFSNGVLRWRHGPGGERYGFRAAACTGALYHVELYLAVAQRPDLAAGLYHYGAHDHRLRRLREGDVRGTLARAAGGFGALASAPTIVVLTSTFWRNAWKYQERAYRHAYWDSGAVVANLLALAAEASQPASVVMGFADAEVDQLVGADGAREAAVALVGVGTGSVAPDAPSRLLDLALPTELLSRREVRYPAIEDAHRASALSSRDEVAVWHGRARVVPETTDPLIEEGRVEDVIRARRSARRFSEGSIARDQLVRAIAAATSAIPGDAFGDDLVEPFVIVNAVDGLARGAYRWVYRKGSGDLTPIREGDLHADAADLALGQDLGAAAAANVYFLSDVDRVLDRLGERGYRVAQIAGGIAGGRMELAATALTFFDDDVTRFFEPAAEGRQVMYLAAIGRRS
jgi:SagB-type dehydrogenase family enzyme